MNLLEKSRYALGVGKVQGMNLLALQDIPGLRDIVLEDMRSPFARYSALLTQDVFYLASIHVKKNAEVKTNCGTQCKMPSLLQREYLRGRLRWAITSQINCTGLTQCR